MVTLILEVTMDIVTYTQVRKNFSLAMDKVCDDHSPIIIPRPDNRSVVMMSLEDYNAKEETLYLKQSPKNYARLKKSIENVKKGHVKTEFLIEE